MSEATNHDWERLSADPDYEEDLGYPADDWDVIKTEKCGRCHILFLPNDEELLQEEAFIVAEEKAVCNPLNHR
ncbi:hypothetical protein ACNS7O_18070 (plasmid) [Haloferacaceae archaeon DSL9]